MAKPDTLKIRLNSTAGTGYFYVAKKNPRTKTGKFEINRSRARSEGTPKHML